VASPASGCGVSEAIDQAACSASTGDARHVKAIYLSCKAPISRTTSARPVSAVRHVLRARSGQRSQRRQSRLFEAVLLLTESSACRRPRYSRSAQDSTRPSLSEAHGAGSGSEYLAADTLNSSVRSSTARIARLTPLRSLAGRARVRGALRKRSGGRGSAYSALQLR